MLGLTKLPIQPIIDQENPLYCSPANPAHPLAQSPAYMNEFTFKLSQVIYDRGKVHRSGSTVGSRRRINFGRPIRTSRVMQGPIKNGSRTLNPVPWRPSFAPDFSQKRKRSPFVDPSGTGSTYGTETSMVDEESDLLHGSVKRVKSDGSHDSSSFILSERADYLAIPAEAFESSQPSANGDGLRIQQHHKRHVRVPQLTLDESSCADNPDDNNVASFIEQLDSMFAGSRLRERISHLKPENHQDLVDILSHFGLLNLASLILLRGVEIKTISLTESMKEVNGLNEGGRDVLHAFTLPDSFTSLTSLNMNNAPLRFSQVRDIVSLPNLKILCLDNTGVGDPWIFVLTAMRSTLHELHIMNNDQITDECVPAFAYIGHLQMLDIRGTAISIHGLRRLAQDFVDEIGSKLSVEFPDACAKYISSRHTQYEADLEPIFPIVERVSQCEGLSISSLKKNLKIHSTANPAIKLTGNQAELCDRLKDILRIREADMKVMRLLDWYDDSVDAIGVDEEWEV
ncbi:hypothetical protein FRB94_011788 [Tulasnella sp. JGI-2019a]|nr:hypothetical protein FRB93_002236 [Tulasnella sp. JGI-2019a]KAG9014610.1 hypothetical protein FRB94_011788 [Tulasnella sp. JGI-2019a]KAG9038947.1 hypothetical protein FRB95_013625 [Tulasnella sp. JGI-2019a]